VGSTGKRTGGSKGLSPRSKAALATVALTAVERLSDPKVRAQLAQQGRNVAALTATWRTQRASRPDIERHRGLRQLDRRITNLEATIAELSTGRPELSDALDAPRELVAGLRTAVGVAAGLPARTRRAAQQRIDGELDAVEALVFEVSLPQR
jgi:hypothetical protein